MEGIPEEEDCDINGNLCGKGDNCFECDEFGFNPFQQNEHTARGNKGDAAVPPITDKGGPQTEGTSTLEHQKETPHHQKGYEIRFKSTFSRVQAEKELQQEKTNQQNHSRQQQQQQQQPKRVSPIHRLTTAFGRTHPNNKSNKMPKCKRLETAAVAELDLAADVLLASRGFPEGFPFRELSVPKDIERSVSELTMRSHGAFEEHRHTANKRRMAYYAVGRAAPCGDHGSSGGNRRCYFGGNAIPYGMPFYAGSVRQGPRTLVVFCLPSALGLPRSNDGRGSPDQFSSTAEGEAYLASLPAPDAQLTEEMNRRYPEQFDTLPMQVRSPHCWRLFIKFCFFSGLPIAEGEMHYRVKSYVVVFSPAAQQYQQQQNEEIALSHEVMEGEKALLFWVYCRFLSHLKIPHCTVLAQ